MPNETSLLNDITSLNNTNSAADASSANNVNPTNDTSSQNGVDLTADGNANQAASSSISRHIIFTLIPANIIFALPIYYFTNFDNDISWQSFNYMFAGYIVVFLLLYGAITYKLYPKITTKAWLIGNVFNLAFSLLINYVIDMFSKQSDWLFYTLSLMQNLVLIWAMLLLWQGLARFWAWLKHIENPETQENSK